jgi:hypothetical protein
MSDYLGNLAARSLNLAGVLRPRLASIFEPLPSFGKQINEYLAEDVPVQSQPVQSQYSNSVPEGKKPANYETLHKPNLVGASSSKQTSQGADSLDARHGLTEVPGELNDRDTLAGSIVPADKVVMGKRVERFPISGEINRASRAANSWEGEHPKQKAAHIQINVPSKENLNRFEPEAVMPPAEIKPVSANLPIQDQPSIRPATAPIKSGQIEIPVDRLPSDAVDDHSEYDPASKSANAWPGEPKPRAAHLSFAVRPGEGSNRFEPEAVMPPAEIKLESANLPIQDQPSMRGATAPIKSGRTEIPVDRLPSDAVDDHSELDPASKSANAWPREPEPKAVNHSFAVLPGEGSNRFEPEAVMPPAEIKPESANLPIKDQPSMRAATAPIKSGRIEIPDDRLPSDAVDDHSEYNPASKSANAWPGEPKPAEDHLSFAVRPGEGSDRFEPEAVIPPAEIEPESANLPIQDQPSMRAATAPIKSGRTEIPVDRLPSDAFDDHSEYNPASKSANAWPGEPKPEKNHLSFAVRPGEGSNRFEPEAVMPPAEIKPVSANLPIQDQPSMRAATAPTDADLNEITVEGLRSEAREEPSPFSQSSKAVNTWAGEHQPINLFSGDLPSYRPSTGTKENKISFSKTNVERHSRHLIKETERKAEYSRSEPSISVTIGRIEVRAVIAMEKPAAKSIPKVQILSLDDYLRLRNGGQR